MDGARLNAMKVAEESKPEPKEVNITPQQTNATTSTNRS